MDFDQSFRRRAWSKPSLHIDKAPAVFPHVSNGNFGQPLTGRRPGPSTTPIPTIRYEAHTSPSLPFERDEQWWAFVVRYSNIRMFLGNLFFWLACIAVHTYLNRMSWHRGVVKFNMVGTPPLHDILHEFLPNTQTYRVLPEIGHVLPVLYLSGLMLYHLDQRSLDCFRTFMVLHGSLLALRGLSFIGTTLPDASQQCHISLFVGSCHDLIFSGHVMIMILSVLLAQHFYYIPPIIRVLIGLDATLVSCMVISSRNHYTVDVVLAVVITFVAYLGFTRHPYLVSLCVESPVNVLSIKCLMDADQPGGLCGCGRPSRTTREGYDRINDAEALKRMTEHAHGALRLMGLRPRVVMTKPQEGAMPHLVAPLPAGETLRADIPLCYCATPWTHNVENSTDASLHSSGKVNPGAAHRRSSSASKSAKAAPVAEKVSTPAGKRAAGVEAGTGGSSSLDQSPGSAWMRRVRTEPSRSRPSEFGESSARRVSLDGSTERLATLRERMDSTNSDSASSESPHTSCRKVGRSQAAANPSTESASAEQIAVEFERDFPSSSPESEAHVDIPDNVRHHEGLRPSYARPVVAPARRGRAHSSMDAAEYEQMLAGAPLGRARGGYFYPTQPMVISPDGRLLGFTSYPRPAGFGDADAEEEAQDPRLWNYDGYEIDPVLARSIDAGEYGEYIPNSTHLANGISQAYQQLHLSARRLLGWNPVDNIRDWVHAIRRPETAAHMTFEEEIEAGAAALAEDEVLEAPVREHRGVHDEARPPRRQKPKRS